jgi:hypothetical protein
MCDGNVNACLKAHRIPVGNLYRQRFSRIWNSQAQQEFRVKTLVVRKNDSFFRSIGNDPETIEAGCYKGCDDLERNMFIHNRIRALTVGERGLLTLMARCF